MNECFQEYIETLDSIKNLEAIGQEKADCAVEDLKLFIKDNRICPPNTLITIKGHSITIKSSEPYPTERILEIEEFTGFKLKFKDNSKIIFSYEG